MILLVINYSTMSKKNNALKQLIKAQMQANAVATAQGREISGAPVMPNVQTGQMTAGPLMPMVASKEASEFVLIKKDIRLSLLLISLVIICIFAIFFVDRSHPFLLLLANQIFKLI